MTACNRRDSAAFLSITQPAERAATNDGAGFMKATSTSGFATLARWCNPGLRMPGVLARVAGLVLLTLALPGQARAQAVDWVLNLNDTGFDPSPAGGLVTYAVQVENNGFGNAPATRIRFEIPGSTRLDSTTFAGCLPGGAVDGPAVVECPVPPLPSDGVIARTVTLRTTGQGLVTLNAEVLDDTAEDIQPDNNRDAEGTTITAGSDIAFDIAAPATAASGSVIGYTLTARNLGPDPATSVTLEFPVPPGLANISAPPNCQLQGSVYRCAVPGPLAVGAAESLTIQGQIVAVSGSTLTVPASSVQSVPTDPNTDNNLDDTSTTVTAGSDLAIAKARAPGGPLVVGDPVTFTLTPRYSGDVPGAIVMTDTIPANYAVGTVDAPGWTCSVTGQTVRCTLPSGSVAGADVPLGPIRIAATTVQAGAPTNVATIAAGGPSDPNPANNSASDGGASIADPFVDLAVSKGGPVPPLVVQGSTYSFVLGSRNIGNVPFFGTLRITDQVPAGMTITGVTPNGWTCLTPLPVAGPGTLVCERVYTAADPLGANEAAPSIVTRVRTDDTGPLVNTATNASPDANRPDLVSGNDTVSYGVTGNTGPNAADLRVVKRRALATLPAGEVQTFELEVVNAGPQTSADIDLTDSLTGLVNGNAGATGAGYVDQSIAAGAATGLVCSSEAQGGTARRLACRIASLPVCTPGVDCPVVTVRVRPGGNAGPRDNTATAISQATADPDLDDNAATVGYAVEARADVVVAKSAAPTTAAAGQALTYVLTATNVENGLSAADDVTVADTLPAGLVFLSATPSSGLCTAAPAPGSLTGASSNNQVVCNLGRLGNGVQRTITIRVQPTNATRGTTLTNTAAVTTATTETDTGNNGASLETPVENPALDLLVNKTDSVDPVPVGLDTVYTVTVRNLGPSAAENVVLTDTLPAGNLRFQSFTVPADGTCGTVPAPNSIGGTLSCSFPALPSGESRAVTITMRGDTKGVTQNQASVRSDESALGFDTNPANDDVRESTTVRTRADMEVASKVATPATVNLRDGFSFTIRVRNNAGPNLAEADDVAVSDTLPAGMQLTGTPTLAVASGSAGPLSCTGAAGATSFSCALGTVTSGSAVDITVPVRVVSVGARPQSLTNTATVSTSSFDTVPGNNSNSGAVTVGSSSVAGAIFRDFNDNAVRNGPGDTGLAGIPVTLSGTGFDGTPVSLTVNTDGSGNYVFPFIPASDGAGYTITHGTISETYLAPGTNTPGSQGGTAQGANRITGVVVPANTQATDYLFAKVPQARVGIAKAVQAGPAVNADGSFSTTFRLTVRNPSLEGLSAMTVTDPLAGAAPAFGTQVTTGSPATAPLAAGTYTMLAAPSGTCGGLNGGFDGSGDTTVASGFALAAGATCTIDIAVRVQPTAPLPPVLSGGARYLNQATVEGTGALSGQTSATNPQLTDPSDNGTNADADGNGRSNEAGENDPTPVAPPYNPAITVVKTADITAFSDPVRAGDTITYAFAVRNAGNVTLTNVTLADPLPGIALSGGPIASLAPGATDAATFTATYALTDADLTAGRVTNRATATGTWSNGPGGPLTVSDASGTAAGNDTPTEVLIGGIALVKTADVSALSNPPRAGETITYRFAVTNTGGAPLTNVTLTDILPDLALSGGPIATLAAGATDSTTFTGAYALKQSDIDAGRVENSATTVGRYGRDANGDPFTVDDVSGTATTNDTPTVVPLAPAGGIRLEKRALSVADTNGSTRRDAGDTVTYGFVVTNTGNVNLSGVTLADPLLTVAGAPVTLAPGASSAAGAFTGTYVLTQADVDRGYVQNTATTTGNAVTAGGQPILDPGGQPVTVTDRSDTGTDPALGTVANPEGTETPDALGAVNGNPTDDPTVVAIDRQAGLRLVKSARSVADTNGNGRTDAGDTVTYGFAVTNTGVVALRDVRLADPLITETGGPVALAVGATNATAFAGTYVLTQADLDRGYVENTATATGEAVTAGGQPILGPGGQPVTASDVSDTGTDAALATVPDPAAAETPDGTGATDGDPANDPTVVTLEPRPAVELVKALAGVADTNGDGVRGAGDTATYAFRVTNAGNVALANLRLADPLIAETGGPIALAVGATNATAFTGTYVLTQADVDRGFVENTATVTGDAVTTAGAPILGPGGTPLTATDVSDAGTAPDGTTVANPAGTETPDGTGATDGDPTNDPVVLTIAPTARIALVKSLAGVDDANGSGRIDAGDRARYAFRVTNTGSVALAGIAIADPLVTGTGGPIRLAPGASNATAFTATYVLTQADLDRGWVDNSATATGNAVRADGTPITGPGGGALTATDVSDSGTDRGGDAVANPEGVETPGGSGATDGDPANDPTVAQLSPFAAIRLVKTALAITDTTGDGTEGAGDTVTYAFAVTNAGSLSLADVRVTDPLVAVTGGPATLAVDATDAATFRASYVLTQADVDRGWVQNTATVEADAVTETGAPFLDANGDPVTAADLSDTGTDPDRAAIASPEAVETPDAAGATNGDPTDDPTVVRITPAARLILVKSVTALQDTNGNGLTDPGDTVTYGFDATNAGSVALAGVTVTDPLAAVTGAPVDLAIGQTVTGAFTATYVLTQEDLDRTYVQNSATATGDAVTATGDPITGEGGQPLRATDVSDTGTAPDRAAVPDPAATETPDGDGRTDGDPTNDPTTVTLGVTASVALVKTVDGSALSRPSRIGDRLTYAFTVTNTGPVTLRNVRVADPLPGLRLRGGPIAALAPGESDSTTFTGTYRLRAEDLERTEVVNQATATGDFGSPGNPQVVTDRSGTETGNDLETVIEVGPGGTPGGLTLEKVARQTRAYVGDTVAYTITAANPARGVPVVADIVDVLPPGFAYVRDSAAIDGRPVRSTLRGNVVTVPGVAIGPGERVALTLATRVTMEATPGDHANRARLLDPGTGRPLAPDATATVRVLADPVFACATVIGRVFDDRNQDGFMNAPPDDRAALTDQTYRSSGKLSVAPERPGGEPGIPGVRLVAPDGLAVTTDEYGRFSVPCAALPKVIGSNFVMKLDARTLPSGYRVTTENPRVVRVTPGMLTKMTFGATLSRVVRIDLDARAFLADGRGTTPRPELEAGLRRLVADIAATPSMLRITYDRGSEPPTQARARVRAVERMLRRLWPANGRYMLNIEALVRQTRAGDE